MSTAAVKLNINGRSVEKSVDARTTLVQLLREQLMLTGTHVGCDTSQCGACTVLMDGKAVKACNILAAQASGAAITTIEGLAKPNGELHPMQAAFKTCHGLQCGFCTPGMVMSACALANELSAKSKTPSETEIREALEGNICRCTGYQNIVKAVQVGLAGMSKAA
jgi:aerobic carbon-monoxide dehydrogenase small subunit